MNRKLFVVIGIGVVVTLLGLVALASQAGTVAAHPSTGSGQVQPQARPSTSSGFLGFGFTYQGQLKQGGLPFTGNCDFQFALYDALTLGARQGATQTVSSLTVRRRSARSRGTASRQGVCAWLTGGSRVPHSPQNF
jgi:hypothetical protein